MSPGFLLPAIADEYRRAVEEFPAYGSVLLRLAIPNLRTVRVVTRLTRGGRGHFCHALHVSVQVGLSHLALHGASLAYSLWGSSRRSASSFLRIAPVSVGLLLPTLPASTRRLLRVFPHTARFFNVTTTVHSYGRRLPGLQFRASLRRANPSL